MAFPRIRPDADSVFAWFRGRAHATSRIPSEDVRGRKSRVVPTPGVCASSLAVMWRPTGPRIDIHKATGAIVQRSPRRARRTPLKPFAQGRPGDRHTCGPPRVHFYRARISGAAGARPSLRPRLFRGRARPKTRARRAARRRSCVCYLKCAMECDGLANCSVIASAAKQSRLHPRRDSGLLRSARNDMVEGVRSHPSPSP